MITFQHSDLKVWTREDKNVMYYVDTDGGEGGPEWKDVRIRQTFEAQTGYMIEFLIVHPGEKHLCKKLPPGIIQAGYLITENWKILKMRVEDYFFLQNFEW